MESKIQQRTHVRGFCLWRILLEVFHSSTSVSRRRIFAPAQHDAKIMGCPCGGDRLGSPAGGRDRLACVSNFPHVNAQPPEEGNTSDFWLFGAMFKGSHNGVVLSLCVALSQSLFLICKARADVEFITLFAHTQRFIHCLYCKPHS